MLRKRINILTATSLLLLALSACGNAGASGDFSNGLVEVQFDLDEGTFDIVDVVPFGYPFWGRCNFGK